MVRNAAGNLEGRRAGEGPLEAARFAIPELPAFHVARSGVVHELEVTPTVSLVLVSAPAGTGKTCAVAEWVRKSRTREVGWVTFDNDDPTFWRYVLHCLSRLGVDVPEAWSPPADSCLGRERVLELGQRLAEMPRRLTLVLDGYELVSRELGNEIDFLLRHSEGRLRLVLIGRVDPVFPLYRHAIAGSLVEVRAAQLALSDEEADALLVSAGVPMGSETVHELNVALQGWAAGLRLASRALVGRPDPEARVSAEVLRNPSLTEFLVEEVLNRQPETLRRIVLDTSIPEVLAPGLVEEIAGPAAPRSFDRFDELKSLVEPDVGQPGWFRYPPFMRELLRAQLAYEDPERVVEVHRRAGRWLRREGQILESLSHLAKVGDWQEVVDGVIDGSQIGMLLVEGPDSPLAAIVRRVPPDLQDPAACLVRAAAALAEGDEQRCDRELEAALASDPGTAPSHARGLSLATLQAIRASRSGDAATAAMAAAVAEQWLDEAPAGPAQAITEVSAVVQLSKGVAALRQGDLAAAGEALERAAEQVPATAAPSFRADCLGRLAIVAALEGHLSHAVRSARESLACASEAGLSPQSTPPAASVALALVGTERFEVEVAREHVETALASPLLTVDPTCRGLVEVASAEIERATGEIGPAIERLQRAAGEASPSDPWLADHLRLQSAWLSISAGEVEQALAALESVEDGDRPEVAVVAAAAYEEQGSSVAVEGLLSSAHRNEVPLGARVSGLLVESLHRSRQRSPGRARQTLDKALHLARPEGLRRPFLDAGPAVQRWLASDPHFAHGSAWLDTSPGASVRRPEPADQGIPGVVVENLTAKELEVLVLLAELLNTDEIAEKMFVSVNTVRTHIRSILRKLGVSRRNAAIRRARELGILES